MEKVIYKDCFIQLVKENLAENTYIGRGNPNAKILFVGREGSSEKPLEEISEASDWQKQIDKNEYPQFLCRKPLDKDHKQFAPGHTWNKYQILHDYIFTNNERPVDNGVNFEQNIFTTEMNVHRSEKTVNADTTGIKERKETFFRTDFIQQFPVVVLACSNYIKPQEIYDIFNVSWKDNNPYYRNSNGSQYWYAHYNENNTKLVIHTIQLSGLINNEEFLCKIGKLIRDFLWYTDPAFRWENGGKEMYDKIQENPDVMETDEYQNYMNRLNT